MRASFLALCVLFALFVASCAADEVSSTGTTQKPESTGLNILDGSPDADTTYLFSDVSEEDGE